MVITISGLLLSSCQPMPVKQEQLKAVPKPSPQTKVEAKKVSPLANLHFVNPDVTPTTDIHFTGKYCNECHEKTPVKGGDPYLKFGGDYNQLCRCHTFQPSDLLHPIGVTPSPAKRKRIPADFPLTNGKLTCDTCHNIYLQCQKSLFKTNFLRGGPYSSRTDFCFNCHEKKRYKKLNPHQQINDKGEIIIQVCLFCHKEKPNQAHATFKDVKFIGNIGEICRRCHHIVGKHPGNALHIGVTPSAKMLKNMEEMDKKYNMILPLENGKMTCITCHNPHEKGVIPEDRPGARGAGSKNRLRLPDNLCKECHHF